MSMQLHPRHDKRLPPYAIDFTEIKATVTLGYDDTTPKTSDLFDITYEPTWKQPPDAVVRYTAPAFEDSLENSWTRKGGHCQNTGISIDALGLNYVKSRTGYKAPDSIKSVKLTSPWPYPTYAEVKCLESDYSTEVGEVIPTWVPAGGTTRDIDIVDKVRQDILNDADYVVIDHYWFRDGDPLNVLLQNSSDDGFILPFPGLDPRNGRPFFGSVAVDSYNFVDKYGLMAMLLGAGADLASSFAQSASVLQQSTGVKAIARRYGIDALQVAGLLGMGMYFEWIDENNLIEQLVPALATGVADDIAGWAVGQLPDKYTSAVSMLGGRITAGDIVGAGASAAALMLYLQMMDDVALHVEF